MARDGISYREPDRVRFTRELNRDTLEIKNYSSYECDILLEIVEKAKMKETVDPFLKRRVGCVGGDTN